MLSLFFFAVENRTYDGYGVDFPFAPYVLLQTFSFNSFSSVDAEFLSFFCFFFFFFLLFPCSLSGGQMRPVSRLCRSATSAAAFPVWRGKSRDMKAECVRMMVRGKEGGGGGREKERGEREQSPTPSVPPSILAQPFQSSHPSGQLQWDLLTNCSDAVQGFL